MTYQYVMTEEEEENYYESDLSTNPLDDSLAPSSSVRHMPLIKANFQYLYHTTQQNWDFNWRVFFVEVLNSVSLAVILCTVAFSVCSGTSIQHVDGYTYDYWMISFTIYGCLIYITNLAVVIRSGQISWFVMFWVTFLSIIPFIVISLLFDTVMSITNGSQYILINNGSTYHYYLVCVAMVFIAFLFEVMKQFIRVIWKPRLSDYFRLLIHQGLENDPSKFDKKFLTSFSQLRDPIQKHKVKKANLSLKSGLGIVSIQENAPSNEHIKKDEELNKSQLEGQADVPIPRNLSDMLSHHLSQDESSLPPIMNSLRKKMSSPGVDHNKKYF